MNLPYLYQIPVEIEGITLLGGAELSAPFSFVILFPYPRIIL